MSQVLYVALASSLIAVGVWAVTGVVRVWLIACGIYDDPNERSSHAAPRPRGGGLAILLVVLPAWGATAWLFPVSGGIWIVLAGALILAALSFVDDLLGVHPALRLAGQTLAVAAGLAVFDAGPVFQGWVPLWADRLLAGLAWLWFVNLFNFMDGIDGISGIETIAVGLGLGLVAAIAGESAGAVALPWLLAGAAGGFLIWNWAPSKIFLGDVGSIPLGYLLGWLLLLAAAKGHWAAALILPGYYLADATWTLLKRIGRGEKPWHAHREHAYQMAVQTGFGHAEVSSRIAVANGVFIVLSIATVIFDIRMGSFWPGIVNITALVIALLILIQLFAGLRQSHR